MDCQMRGRAGQGRRHQGAEPGCATCSVFARCVPAHRPARTRASLLL